jgi:hypothetical protein
MANSGKGERKKAVLNKSIKDHPIFWILGLVVLAFISGFGAYKTILLAANQDTVTHGTYILIDLKTHLKDSNSIRTVPIIDSALTSTDELLNFCVKEGIKYNRPYVIKSITQIIDAERQNDTFIVRERITYDILALRNIRSGDHVFEERYFKPFASDDRWVGSNDETPVTITKDSEKYYVGFNCNKGESITLVTGVNYIYDIHKLKKRTENIGTWHVTLDSNQELWSYPNDSDVIGKLTMIFTSKDYKFESRNQDALFFSENDKTKISIPDSALVKLTANISPSRYSTISYTWRTLLPYQYMALRIKWVP